MITKLPVLALVVSEARKNWRLSVGRSKNRHVFDTSSDVKSEITPVRNQGLSFAHPQGAGSQPPHTQDADLRCTGGWAGDRIGDG